MRLMARQKKLGVAAAMGAVLVTVLWLAGRAEELKAEQLPACGAVGCTGNTNLCYFIRYGVIFECTRSADEPGPPKYPQ